MLDISVVVPTRNAENTLEDCLASIAASEPTELIIVDGNSTDRTLAIARRYADAILSDEGRGLPVARMMGVRAARARWVALIDADVTLPRGALGALLSEFRERGYTGLQAGLHSVSGPGYWGRALAHHHLSGRSKDWFGVVATIFERDVFLAQGLDEGFLSGEDIELRWRLARAGHKLGVSRRVVVRHRFGDSFAFARGQWLADGHGLGRMIGKHGVRGKAALLLALPAAAAVRGILLSVARLDLNWILYYLCFAAYNYAGMASELGQMWRGHASAPRGGRRDGH